MSASLRVPDDMSVEEFLAWDSGDGQAWQLVDGEPQAMAPAGWTHGAIQSELASLLVEHLRRRGGPCVVVTAPGIIPRANAARNVRVPDLAVSCAPDFGRDATLANPMLVIEILSLSNRAETWSNVWTYTSIPSVTEIVVVHAAAVRADILRRQPDGTWPDEPEKVTEGDMVLDSIGFRAPLQALYRTTRLAGQPDG